MKRFLFEYKCLGINYRLELYGETLNEVLTHFSKIYTDIEIIYIVRELEFAETISNLKYPKNKLL